MKIQKHSGAAHLIIVIILVLGLAGSLGYIVWDKVVNKEQDVSSSVQDKDDEGSAPADEVVDPYEGWKTYKTDQYDISFKYPIDWSVGEPNYPWQDQPYLSRSVKVANANGEVVASLTLGVTGLGGACGDYQPTYTVLESIAVEVGAKKPVAMSFISSKDKLQQGTYDVRYGLTDNYIDKQDFNSCLIYMVYSSNLTGIQGVAGDYLISFGTLSQGVSFSSLDDVNKYLRSDEYDKIKKMVMSLSY